MKQRHAHPARAARCFTLVELVLACALLAILLVAGRGAVVLANKSARSVPADQSVALSSALDEITTDIQCAIQIVRATSNAVGVVVPDRNGDGEDEWIDYEWSGVAGDPLVKTLNGGSPQTVVASMQSFDVSTVQQSITVAGTPTKNTERLIGGNSTGSGLYSSTITATASRAASFVPSLPATSTSWNLTRVRVMVRQSGTASGSFSVQIQSTNAQMPSGQVIATAAVAESDLSASFGWKDVLFSDANNLSTVSPVAIVVTQIGAVANPCDLQHTNSGGAQVAGNALYSSSNGGVSWSLVSGNDMIYAVYGIPNTPTPTVAATGVSAVRITAESSPGVVMSINVPASNVPQL